MPRRKPRCLPAGPADATSRTAVVDRSTRDSDKEDYQSKSITVDRGTATTPAMGQRGSDDGGGGSSRKKTRDTSTRQKRATRTRKRETNDARR